MAAPVVLEVSSQTAQALSSLAALSDRLLKVGDAGVQMGRKTGVGGAAASATLSSVARSAAGVATGILGVGSALAVVSTALSIARRELDATKQFTATASERGITFQKKLAELYWQLPESTMKAEGVTEADIRQQIIEGAQGVDLTTVVDVMIASISAGLATSLKDRIALAADLVRLRPDLPADQMTELVGGAQRLTVGYPNLKPREALGMMLAATPISAANKVGEFARYGAPTASNLGAMGLDLRESLGLISGMSVRIGDTNMRVTSTLVTRALQHITEYAKANLDKNLSGMAAIRAVRDNPKAQQYFLGVWSQMKTKADSDAATDAAEGRESHIGGEARGLAALIEYLQPSNVQTRTKQLIDIATSDIPTVEQSQAWMAEKERRIRGTPGSGALSLDLAANQGAQRVQVEFPGLAAHGRLRKLVEEMPTTWGVGSAWASKLAGEMEGLVEPSSEYDTLQKGVAFLERKRVAEQAKATTRKRVQPDVFLTETRPLTPQETVAISALTAAIKQLHEDMAAMRAGQQQPMKVIDVSPKYEQPLAAGQHTKRR